MFFSEKSEKSYRVKCGQQTVLNDRSVSFIKLSHWSEALQLQVADSDADDSFKSEKRLLNH